MNRIKNLRIVGIAEGISFLILLGIAMPLKYYFGFPLAVKYTGWAHGLLFILFIIAVFLAVKPMKWNFLSVLIALAASLIPFGTFVLDRQLRRREKELAGR
jgi:integral membrane protein